jgi:microcystin-dependent protein
MTPYLGMLFAFAGNFAISEFQMCNGQLIAISQNQALFSILGTYYGGNGINTFALPDLRGRTIIHQGTGPGLPTYVVGEAAGTASTNILTSNLPAHTHTFNVNSTIGNTPTPGNTTYLAAGPATGSGPNASQLNSYTTTANNTNLAPNSIGPTGNGIPLNIMQPFLTATYLIAMYGIFPSRN